MSEPEHIRTILERVINQIPEKKHSQEIGLNKISCCKDCVPPKRHIGCHSTCEEFLAEKAEYEAEKAIENKARKEYADFTAAKVGAVTKTKKLTGRR